MRTVFLVRHGEVSNPNHVVYADLPGFHLSPLGVLQAHAAADHLATREVEAVFTSPLDRAVETATAIASRHGLAPIPDPSLTETGQFPGWTGERWDEIPVRYPGQLERYLADASSLEDAVESIADVARRVVGLIMSAIATRTSIVVVGHQDPIQAARLTMIRRPLSELAVDPPAHASVITLTTSTDSQPDNQTSWYETEAWVPIVA